MGIRHIPSIYHMFNEGLNEAILCINVATFYRKGGIVKKKGVFEKVGDEGHVENCSKQ